MSGKKPAPSPSAEPSARAPDPCFGPGPGPVLRCYLPPGHEGPCLTWEDALRRTYGRTLLDLPEPPTAPPPDAATLLRAIDGLIAALADPDAHDAARCCDCPTLALATWRDRDWEARCDEHADRSGHELSYAPAVRTLRAAMEGR